MKKKKEEVVDVEKMENLSRVERIASYRSLINKKIGRKIAYDLKEDEK